MTKTLNGFGLGATAAPIAPPRAGGARVGNDGEPRIGKATLWPPRRTRWSRPACARAGGIG
jgi:hypothetical protein